MALGAREDRTARAVPAIIISIMLTPILQGVDTTSSNVTLRRMQGGLSAAQDQVARVLTSYIITAAIMMPLTG